MRAIIRDPFLAQLKVSFQYTRVSLMRIEGLRNESLPSYSPNHFTCSCGGHREAVHSYAKGFYFTIVSLKSINLSFQWTRDNENPITWHTQYSCRWYRTLLQYIAWKNSLKVFVKESGFKKYTLLNKRGVVRHLIAQHMKVFRFRPWFLVWRGAGG